MLWQVMGALFVLAFIAFVYTESTGNPLLQAIGAEGLSWEGKDARFDLGAVSLFSTVTTSASCGAVAVMHDSLMPLSGMVTMVLMQLGEVVFGGLLRHDRHGCHRGLHRQPDGGTHAGISR